MTRPTLRFVPASWLFVRLRGSCNGRAATALLICLLGAAGVVGASARSSGAVQPAPALQRVSPLLLLCSSVDPPTRSRPTILFTLAQNAHADVNREHIDPGPFSVYATTVDGRSVWRIGRNITSHVAATDGVRVVVGRVVQIRIWDGLKVLDLHRPCRHRLGGHYANDPTWSPDRQRIAFADAYAGADHVVIGSKTGLVRLPVRYASAPAWSPDGRQIAFVTTDDNPKLWLADADGRHVRSVADEDYYCNLRPEWLRDGDSILFCGKHGKLSLISEASAAIRTLSATFDYDSVQRSPTSDLLAVAKGSALNETLFLIDPHGIKPPRRIVSGLGQDASFTWSGDGRQIFVSRFDQVWSVKPDGTGLRKITHCPPAAGGRACAGAVWLPRAPSGFRRVQWRDVD